MYLVLDIWHGASTIDELHDHFKIVFLSWFNALAIMKDEPLIVTRYYFGIYVRYACLRFWHILYDRCYQTKIQECRSLVSVLTASFVPKVALITEDFLTPVYESMWHQHLDLKYGQNYLTLPITKTLKPAQCSMSVYTYSCEDKTILTEDRLTRHLASSTTTWSTCRWSNHPFTGKPDHRPPFSLPQHSINM